MKRKEWTSVQASNGGNAHNLPAGAYVLRIVNVRDVARHEYLQITYDIAEGEHRGLFGDEWSDKNEWKHQTVASYSDKAEGLFKRFLECVEASNPSFNIAMWEQTSDEHALIGKIVGAGFGEVNKVRTYGEYAGKPSKDVGFPVWLTADDARSGKFKMPEPKYRIQDAKGANYEDCDKETFESTCRMYAAMSGQVADATSSVADEDIPF